MANLKEIQEVLLVIGGVGNDNDHSLLTPHGMVHVPGNNPEAREAISELTRSYAKLQAIAAREQVGEQAGR